MTRTREAMGRPVEAWAEVVHKHLAWELLPDSTSEATRLLKIRLFGLKPEKVGVWCIGGDTAHSGLASVRMKPLAIRRTTNLHPSSVVIVTLTGARYCGT